MTPIRSPFFYVGDKYKLMPQIRKEFPERIHAFIEPFCGGGSVFLNVNAFEYHLNDINSSMIDLHKFLISYKDKESDFFSLITNVIVEFRLSASFIGRTVPDNLKKVYVKTYYARYNKEGYIRLRAEYNSDKSNMLFLYLLLIYGFNHMVRYNAKGEFNLPVGNVDFNFNVEKALKAYFKAARERKLFFYNQDFETFLNSFTISEDDLIYLDPPYLITFSEYNKIWNKDEEQRLLDLLDTLSKKNIRFAISNLLFQKGKYNALFNYWARQYSIINISSNYISYHDNSNKNSVEVLVKNF